MGEDALFSLDGFDETGVEEMDGGKRRNGGHVTVTFNELARLLRTWSRSRTVVKAMELERYFTGLSSFLRNIDRQYMGGNKQFSEYVIEL